MGDYATATPHLTDMQDLAYRRLLDVYYRFEKPIPIERQKTYLLVRAANKAMREAVDAILNEFFQQEEDGWHHRRCDAEILKAQGKMENGQEKKDNERERQKRHRAARKELFEALREKGIKPAFDTPTVTLQEMLRHSDSHAPVTRDSHAPETANQYQYQYQSQLPSRDGSKVEGQSVDKAILEAMGELPQSASLHNTTAIHRLIADGYSLEQRILPAIREQAAKGKSFQSWGYIDKILRASPPTTATPDDELWRQRLDVCRRLRKWDVRYGPQPHTPGCRVPAQILHDTDGQDWTEWRPGDDL